MESSKTNGHPSDILSQAPISRRTSRSSLSSDEKLPPSYDDVVSSTPPGYRHDGNKPGFPPRFNLYYKHKGWRHTTWTLGEHRDQPLFTIFLTSGWKGHTFTLHQGLQDDAASALLAEVSGKGYWAIHNNIALPNHHIFEEIHTKLTLKTAIYSFTAPVQRGEKVVPERFEWRQSHGPEVTGLSSSHAWGYKLVRLESPHASRPSADEPESSRRGGKRAERDVGQTSDGKDVVAVWADNMKTSMTKYVKFQLLGDALGGAMGEVFDIMAVATGLRIWQVVRLGKAGGSASAGTKAETETEAAMMTGESSKS